MRKINILLAVGMMLSVLSCKKTENLDREIVGLGGDKWPPSDLDNWLTSTFSPYNMDIKYRWDGSDLDVSKTMIPPNVDRVKPTMETVKLGWIDVYTAEAGEAFIKQFAPRQYVLVGSLKYNGTTVTLGEAEGGNKVTLYNINNFDKTNATIVKPVLKTIHHEFTHILNQTVNFSKEYPLITPGGYTSDWNNTTMASANAAGFITEYAQAAPGEDFAEMVSVMLTEGKASYNAKVDNIVEVKLDSIPDPLNPPFIIAREKPNATAQAFIRKKEANVITYFKQSFGIEFPRLQNRTNYAIAQNAPVALSGLFGNRRQFTSLTVDPVTMPGMSSAFLSTWNTAKTGMAAIGYIPKSFTLFFYPRAGELVLRLNFSNAAGTNYLAHFAYKVAYDASRNLTLTYVRRDGNANVIAPGLVALTNYLTTGSFGVSWRYDSNFLEFGQMTKTTDPNSFFFGNLGAIKY